MNHSGRISRATPYYGRLARAGGVGAQILYKKTAIGDPVCITDGVEGTTALMCKCTLLATQSGTPTPDSPIPIVGKSAVTITRSEDGTIWTSDLNGTVYGGVVDLVSGEITIDREFTSSPSWTLMSPGLEHPWIRIAGNFAPASEENRKKWMSNKVVTCVSSGARVPDEARDGKSIWQYGATTARIYLPAGSGRAYADEMMDGLTIVYPLSTPITRKISPLEIEMLDGSNTFQGDCGDMEIKYLWSGS